MATNSDHIVHARMSWALIAMGFTLFMGVLLWGILTPHMHDLADHAKNMSSSPKADTGADRVLLIWQYWPLWFGGTLLLYGYRRAVNESRRGL